MLPEILERPPEMSGLLLFPPDPRQRYGKENQGHEEGTGEEDNGDPIGSKHRGESRNGNNRRGWKHEDPGQTELVNQTSDPFSEPHCFPLLGWQATAEQPGG